MAKDISLDIATTRLNTVCHQQIRDTLNEESLRLAIWQDLNRESGAVPTNDEFATLIAADWEGDEDPDTARMVYEELKKRFPVLSQLIDDTFHE